MTHRRSRLCLLLAALTVPPSLAPRNAENSARLNLLRV
jgi:hypothetical protein